MNEQIDSIYEHLVRQGTFAIRLDHYACSNLLRCASCILRRVSELRRHMKSPEFRRQGRLLSARDAESCRLACEKAQESDSGEEGEEDEDRKRVTLERLFSIKEPAVIIIKSIEEIPRSVINDLLHMLVKSRIANDTKYSLIMTMTGSVDVFHEKINTSTISYLNVKIITLSSIRDTILAIIAKYVLDYTYLIQPNPECLCWIYEQVLMYNLSLKSFEKIVLYMVFSKIFRSSIFFLLKYYDSETMRHKDYQKVFEALSDAQKEDLKESIT